MRRAQASARPQGRGAPAAAGPQDGGSPPHVCVKRTEASSDGGDSRPRSGRGGGAHLRDLLLSASANMQLPHAVPSDPGSSPAQPHSGSALALLWPWGPSWLMEASARSRASCPQVLPPLSVWHPQTCVDRPLPPPPGRSPRSSFTAGLGGGRLVVKCESPPCAELSGRLLRVERGPWGRSCP